jgi:heterodisulfide reductase subunit B
MNLDMLQAKMNKKFGTNFNIPVCYFTQLMAVAMGSSPADVGMNKNYVPFESTLAKSG